METTLLILCGCALVFVPTLLFLLLVQPIWTFIEVCGTTLFGRLGKIVWLLCLLIFITVASIPYALFISASSALRKATILCILLLGVVAGVGYGAVHLNPDFKRQVSQHIEEFTKAVDRVEHLSKIAKNIPSNFRVPGFTR
jgi:hypothetical protein